MEDDLMIKIMEGKLNFWEMKEDLNVFENGG
jgi:hypothetical protein